MPKPVRPPAEVQFAVAFATDRYLARSGRTPLSLATGRHFRFGGSSGTERLTVSGLNSTLDARIGWSWQTMSC